MNVNVMTILLSISLPKCDMGMENGNEEMKDRMNFKENSTNGHRHSW